MPIARSDRILLRDFEFDDFPSVHRFASDPDVTRYLSWGPNDEDQTRQFLEMAIDNAQKSPRHNFELAIVIRDSSKLIGSCGLLGQEDNTYEIGICLAKPNWGKGIGKEAIRLLTQFATEKLQAARIIARIEPENTVSIHLFRKQGFVFPDERQSETLVGIFACSEGA